MILYHGSKSIIERPEYGKGKLYNDYGLGFYCTEYKDMAKEWAVSAGKNGFVNEYEIDTEGLKILDLSDECYCVLNWLAVLLENRTFNVFSPIAAGAREYILSNFNVEYKDVDIIKGFRADDSYFSFAQDFLNNTITLKHLADAMMLGDLGKQVVIKSRIAFEKLRYKKFETAEAKFWFPKKKSRDDKARSEYFSSRNAVITNEDVFVFQIISEGLNTSDIKNLLK